MSQKKGPSQNVALELAAKRSKLKFLKSWLEKLVTNPKSMKFLACAQIEILNNFLCVKVSLCIQDMH